MMITVNPALAELGRYPLAELQEFGARLRAQGRPVYDFSVGDPDEPTPAFIRHALIEAVYPSTRYPTARGQATLRTAVSSWLQARHGVSVDPETSILPASGSKEAIFHLPLAVIDPASSRRSVLWGEPGYPVYGRGTLFAGGISDPICLRSEDGWRLELGDLPHERLAQARIAWLNYPHNPTGATVDVDYLRRQLVVAREHDILLCSDECYQDIWFADPAPSLLEVCDGDLAGVMVFASLSKRSGMTGYRIAAMVGDPEMVGRLTLLRPNIGTAPPDPIQLAAAAAWSDQAHVDERRRVFAAKRAVLLAFLQDAGFEVSPGDGSLYLWVRAPGGDDATYVGMLAEEGILASPGRAFGEAGRGWFRLALVPTPEECVRATDIWGAAIEAGRLDPPRPSRAPASPGAGNDQAPAVRTRGAGSPHLAPQKEHRQ